MVEVPIRWSQSRPGPTITVAELLARRADVPPGYQVDKQRLAVSVGSLLRREGRAPHAVDRPVRPRGQQSSAATPGEGAPGRGRRAAVAASTLLAAGSVFGATAVNDSTVYSGLTGNPQPLNAPPGGQSPAAPAGDQNVASGLPAPPLGAAASAADPAAGSAPSSDWTAIAFPQGVVAADAPLVGAAAESGSNAGSTVDTSSSTSEDDSAGESSDAGASPEVQRDTPLAPITPGGQATGSDTPAGPEIVGGGATAVDPPAPAPVASPAPRAPSDDAPSAPAPSDDTPSTPAPASPAPDTPAPDTPDNPAPPDGPPADDTPDTGPDQPTAEAPASEDPSAADEAAGKPVDESKVSDPGAAPTDGADAAAESPESMSTDDSAEEPAA